MKRKITRQEFSIGLDRSYTPNTELTDFFHAWLHLHKKREKLGKEGRDISREEKQAIRNLDVDKVRILDKVIFPSMANLIYFFEAIAISPRLAEAFEEQIAELLDPRNTKEVGQLSANHERFTSMQFRENNLTRLVMAMLNIPSNKMKMRKRTTDFRINLMFQLQTVVGDMMDELIHNEFRFSQIWRSAFDDYQRMIGWSALLSSSTDEYPKEYDRRIGFLPITLSNKSREFEKEFNF